MLDFESELNKLLSREWGMLPQYEFAELAAAGQNLLAELEKKQADVSLQIEEIYDLAKEQHGLDEALKSEKTMRGRLVSAAVGVADLIEYFHAYARGSGSEDLKNQADMMWQNATSLLASCGIYRFGEAGEPLNPQIHTVKASAESPVPREHVTEVLQTGYAYQNSIMRKAAVVVSLGQETAAEETGQSDDAARVCGTGDVAEQQDDSTEQRNDSQTSDSYLSGNGNENENENQSNKEDLDYE
jgi:molecular chaperone GrpE (heat shock protein)